MEEEKTLYCLECNWKIPKDLAIKLKEGDSIICERCGFKNEQAYPQAENKGEPLKNKNEFEEIIQKSIKFAKDNIMKPIKDKVEKYRKEREEKKIKDRSHEN